MAQSTCQSCSKLQLFLERMMYCSFCGTHYTETEIFNASQRIKQEGVLKNWWYSYAVGGALLVLVILPLILRTFVTDAAVQVIDTIAFVLWLVLVVKIPFARGHAKRLYPERGAD